MDHRAHPYRSVLYVPGSRDRALEKAKTLPVDAIIFDLEDAVAVEEKTAARRRVADTLGAGGYGPRARIVRINGFDTPWALDDLDEILTTAPDAILLPKVTSAKDIMALASRMDTRSEATDTTIWAMMETPRGILNAAEIAAEPRMAGFVMGTNDLAKDLGSRAHTDRIPLLMALQTCLMAARAHGLVCVDGVYNAFKDEDGLRRECLQGRNMGFDGKTLINPVQVAIANAAFAPDADEIALAERQIAAFEAVTAKGEGVAVVDGSIVENLHVETARATLAKAKAISELEAF